jgi:hypothetical protein
MAALSTIKPGGLTTDGVAALRINATQTQSQINAQPKVVAQRAGKTKTTLRDGDFGATFGTEYVTFSQGASKGTSYSIRLPRALAQYVALQSGSGAPDVDANFPNEGDFGWYVDTDGPTYYWVVNYGGALVSPTLSTLPGTLTFAQHGDLSAGVGTTHGFAQISGTITAAQHGDFTAVAANDNLHALATAARPGFLSATFFSLLNGATAAQTANTLVKRDGSGAANFQDVGVPNGGAYYVNSQQVVGARQTGWGPMSGTVTIGGYTTYTAPTITGPTAAEVQGIADTLQGLSRRVGGIVEGIRTHGLFGT